MILTRETLFIAQIHPFSALNGVRLCSQNHRWCGAAMANKGKSSFYENSSCIRNPTDAALDETLTPDDAADILDELLPAQNQSYVLGLKFKLPQSEVEGIKETYSKPRNRLLQILIEFLKQAEPRPTWRFIVDALRTPAVNLPALASKVESAHSGPPGPPSGIIISPTHLDLVNQSKLSGEGEETVAAVHSQVQKFHQRFNEIKEATVKQLIACQIAVTAMVFWLTSIKALDKHKVFLEKNLEALEQCRSHWMLFAKLNLYWNYLAYDLLYQFLEVLTSHYEEFRTISENMAAYKEDLERFRQNTPLRLFCRAELMPLTGRDVPPPGFQEMVMEFNWSEKVTLEEVERFRKRYAELYKLEDCAMMVNSIIPGSFIVTWFVPVSIVEAIRQKKKGVFNLFTEFQVTRLVIAGKRVFPPKVSLYECMIAIIFYL